MILSKEDYLYYRECDKNALGQNNVKIKHRLFKDAIWKYERLLRKAEYIKNCKHGLIPRLYGVWIQYRFVRLGEHLGMTIGLNVIGPGLAIVHSGTIVISHHARIGANLRIHEGVTIGVSGDGYLSGTNAPIIGNNVFIGSGAKIIGGIHIADNVAVGANAVVILDIIEPKTTWAGVPARMVSHRGSGDYMPQNRK